MNAQEENSALCIECWTTRIYVDQSKLELKT